MLGNIIISKSNVNALEVSKLNNGMYTVLIEHENKVIKKLIIKQ